MKQRSVRRRWLKALSALLAVGAIWYVLLLVQICRYSTRSDASPADAAIVLGAAVWDARPSPVFEERINHAIHLYKTGHVKVLVFTGGLGEDDSVSESEAARAYALEQGVAAEDVRIESVSRITFENLVEARKIIEREGFSRVLVVSDPLHMKRALTMATDLGLDAHPSPTPTSRYRSWRSRFGFLLREGRFYALYLLRRPFMRKDE